jgi:oligopeptide/dipeptide ABC transporter ATP-binding protein
MDGAPILVVDGLSVAFPSDDGAVVAVDGVSFELGAGETLGVVGESGSGKSVTSLAILGLLPKRARVSGSVKFRGEELLGRPDKQLRPFRGEHLAIVFQDALASLNPVFRVGDQIGEAITAHHVVGKVELQSRVLGLLDLVGISNPSERANQYPHEFSGGMRQRAMIAMAIANEPDVLIADEPTTALDVTIQAQVMEVLDRIKERTRSAIVLITHDMGVIAGVADRVMVMYAGRQVEVGSVDQIFYESRHPYTLGLLASLPRLDRRSGTDRLQRIPGQPPSLVFLPPGCAFNPRCVYARHGVCDDRRPELHPVGEGHQSSCQRVDALVESGVMP